MKKSLSFILALVALLSLAACGKKEYAHDGTFVAFEVSDNYGAPQVSWVEVTIKDGKIESYYIDERQSVVTATIEKNDDNEDEAAVSFAWNTKTKKELKDDYGMTVVPGTIQVEWYVQAASIEAKWLADGVDSVELDEDGYITNMPTEATMVGTTYNKLAKAAVANAKAGKAIAFELGESYGAPQISWVEVTFEKNEVKSYYIDERQSTLTATIEKNDDDEDQAVATFAWNAKTKKELKDDYGMTVVPGTIQVEWYVQAASIEAKWLADGVDSVELDEDGYITNMPTEATMVGTTYNKLAKAAVAKVK